jgi:hypothetical protein
MIRIEEGISERPDCSIGGDTFDGGHLSAGAVVGSGRCDGGWADEGWLAMEAREAVRTEFLP